MPNSFWKFNSISDFACVIELKVLLTGIKQAQCGNSSWPQIDSFNQNILTFLQRTPPSSTPPQLFVALSHPMVSSWLVFSTVINSICYFILFEGFYESQTMESGLSGFSLVIFLRSNNKDKMFSIFIPFILYLLPAVPWYIYTALITEPFLFLFLYAAYGAPQESVPRSLTKCDQRRCQTQERRHCTCAICPKALEQNASG